MRQFAMFAAAAALAACQKEPVPEAGNLVIGDEVVPPMSQAAPAAAGPRAKAVSTRRRPPAPKYEDVMRNATLDDAARRVEMRKVAEELGVKLTDDQIELVEVTLAGAVAHLAELRRREAATHDIIANLIQGVATGGIAISPSTTKKAG